MEITKVFVSVAMAGIIVANVATPIQAGLWTELAKLIGRKGAAEAGEQSGKQIIRRGATAAARHGTSEAIAKAASSATAHAAGDALLPAARLSAQNSRRLLMLKDEIAATGQAGQVTQLLAKHGQADQIVDFLWRNKGTLAGTAVVATLVANPDEAIQAATQLGETTIETGGEYIAKPLADSAAHAASDTIGHPVIKFAFAVFLVLLSTYTAVKLWSVSAVWRSARTAMRQE